MAPAYRVTWDHIADKPGAYPNQAEYYVIDLLPLHPLIQLAEQA
jgi:hypothetical protein